MNSLVESTTLDDGTVITDKDYAALALGQFNYGVSLKEITSAYSIFVNKGIYNETRSYYKVTDKDGNIILEDKYSGKTVISEENAIIMTKMLQNVVAGGTASGISLKETIECAGKTGTTQNNYDRWFVGYTPYFIGGVWYGYEYPKALNGNSSGICVEIWDEIMTKLHKRYLSSQKETFDSSDKIVAFEYCRDSGMIATKACKKDPRGDRRETGYFIKGSEPDQECTCHVLVRYDTVNGGIAVSECSFENTENVGLITVKRVFPTQIYVTDAQYVWQDIGKNIMPETSPELAFFTNALAENEYCGISYGSVQYNRLCRADFDYWKWLENKNE